MKLKPFICQLLLLCCLMLESIPAFALDIPRDCSDLEMLKHKWETQYFADLKFNRYLTTVPELKCDTRTYKFIKAIWVIQNIKNSPEFGNIYELLKNHVKEFRIFSSQPFTACGNAQTDIGSMSLYLCAFSETTKKDAYPWNEDVYIRNLFRLISTIVHELRHLQMPIAAKHVDCPNGEVKACDLRFDTDPTIATAYAYEILYKYNVLELNPFDPRDRELIEKDLRSVTRQSFVEPVPE